MFKNMNIRAGPYPAVEDLPFTFEEAVDVIGRHHKLHQAKFLFYVQTVFAEGEYRAAAAFRAVYPTSFAAEFPAHRRALPDLERLLLLGHEVHRQGGASRALWGDSNGTR